MYRKEEVRIKLKVLILPDFPTLPTTNIEYKNPSVLVSEMGKV